MQALSFALYFTIFCGFVSMKRLKRKDQWFRKRFIFIVAHPK